MEPGGIVQETFSARLGEAWDNGPVVLSWADVDAGGANDRDGENVVYHEFAHKLDMIDGSADGVPRLENDAEYDAWAEIMSREYQELVTLTEQGRPPSSAIMPPPMPPNSLPFQQNASLKSPCRCSKAIPPCIRRCAIFIGRTPRRASLPCRRRTPIFSRNTARSITFTALIFTAICRHYVAMRRQITAIRSQFL